MALLFAFDGRVAVNVPPTPSEQAMALSAPIDTLSPPQLLLPAGTHHWRSEAGFYCTGLTYMDECGKVAFTLVAYQNCEEVK